MADHQPSTSKNDGSNIPSKSSTQGDVTPARFKKRKGTTNKGVEYENLNVANLILNLLKSNNNDPYYISSNDDEYGSFDDVVLENTTPNGTKSWYAIQLKHSTKGTLRNNQLTVSQGDFSIQKYAKDFKQIKNHNLSQLHVILFTNLKSDISGDDTVIKLEGEDNFDIRIKQVKIDQENLFNTSDSVGRCYQFEIVENEATSRNMEKAAEYRTFFQNFKLYTNQRNADELKEDVIVSFRNYFCCEETTAKEYLEFVSKWSSLEGIKEKLNNQTVKHAIAKLLLSPFVINLSLTGEAVNENMELLRSAICKFDVTLLDEENCDKIKKMWQDLGSNLKNDKETTEMANRYQFLSSLNRDVTKLNDKEKNLLLWLRGECPTIVPKNTITIKTIELCPRKKFILLGNGDAQKIQNWQVLQNLADLKWKLDETEYNEILNNFKCSLQEKQQINLRELIDGCDKLSECITINELVEMLDGSFIFGETKEQLPVPHIERYISKNIIDFKGIDDVMNNRESRNLFIISCFGRLNKNKNNFNNFNIITIEDYLRKTENKSYSCSMTSRLQENSKKNVYVSQNECSELEFQQISKKNFNKNCHHLQVTEDEELEWIQTKGDISDLMKHRKHGHFLEESDLVNYKKGNTKINIICDDPGMGKSILLKSMKNNYSPTFWVILIAPTDISTFIKEKKERQEFVDYIIDKKHKKDATLVRYLNDCNRVTYLWDGLDEVREEYLEDVFSTIEKLTERGNFQWIISRRHLQLKLEKRFNVFARRVKEFDVPQQQDYITKRLNTLESDRNNTITKIENCLKVAKFNDILGIPQQIFMLTELLIQNSEKFKKLFMGLFSLVELYEHFVEEKISIFLKEKVKLSHDNDYYYEMLYEREKRDEIKNCQQLALINVFDSKILNDLKIELKERNTESSCIKGIVIKVGDESLQFIHNSYAEYFAALYLFERYKSGKLNNLQKYIFKERFRNIRFIFDLMLAKNHPAHIGVLYKNCDIVKEYLQDLSEIDDGGRTLLHLACAWGNSYPLLTYEKDGEIYLIEEYEVLSIKEESSDYCSILGYLTEQNIHNECDKIFNMRPIDYADKSLSLYPIIITLLKKQDFDFRVLENFKDNFRILWYCVKLDYSDIFDVIPNIAEKQTQTKRRKYNLLHMAAEFNAKRYLRAYLKHKKISNVNDIDAFGFTPLYVACQKGHREIVNDLIINKAEINIASEDGATPLYIACQEGYREVVNDLITNKAEVNIACEAGLTPLHMACAKGHREIVNDLIMNKAEINIACEAGSTPLYIACQNGHCEIVNDLIMNKAEINIACEAGSTPLYIACQNGHREIVNDLIMNKAEINIACEDGATPLYIACQEGYREVVNDLITNKAEVNISLKTGTTPLYIACKEGYREVVNDLITNKAEINIACEHGWTPLHIACDNGHSEIVNDLITNKAEINIANKIGATPLYIACQKGHHEIVNNLMMNKAEINIACEDGKTPLHIACHNGYREIVNYLITNKAEINIACEAGLTPLHVACAKGHREIVNDLIMNKAEINIACEDGATPLYIACHKGHREIVNDLIMNKAEINIACEAGLTPLHVACAKGHREIVNDLIMNKAEINIACEDGATPLYIACAEGHREIVNDLIINKAEIYIAKKNGASPLYVACQNGYREIVNYLIMNKAEVNIACEAGLTPLHIACAKGHRKIVSDLIMNTAEINIACEDGDATPLYIACYNGHREIVNDLIMNKAEINIACEAGLTPLHIACAKGHREIVSDLIMNKAEINIACESGLTPLHIACAKRHREIVNGLIMNKAEINIACKDGATPLYIACAKGHREIVNDLIMNKAEINIANKNGASPLYVACQSGYREIVNDLIMNKAEVDAANKYGFTPIYIARLQKHWEIFEQLIKLYTDANASDDFEQLSCFACLNGDYDMVDHLIEAGLHINKANELGLTPLHFACYKGHRNVIDLLIKAHADVNIADKYGFTPLHTACLNGNLDLVETLTKNNADVNAVDICGITPFYLACRNGDFSIVQYLIIFNADINHPSNCGITPIQEAVARGHLLIVKMLIDQNVNMNSIDSDGDTLLHEACLKRNCDIAELLIKSGADVNIKNNDNLTPLEIAQRRGYSDIVFLLQDSAIK